MITEQAPDGVTGCYNDSLAKLETIVLLVLHASMFAATANPTPLYVYS
jgi:hypothetical protein